MKLYICKTWGRKWRTNTIL